jgi:AcrR family transcriptional regulator
MADAEAKGRSNQKKRTRKDLLEAAARLMKQGRPPSLEEVAEEALVSRATAYRYFSGIEALLLEAALDMAVPTPDELFEDEMSGDPVVRLDRVDSAMHDMMAANEASLRMMLIHSLEQRLKGGDEGGGARQNRRSPLIEAALDPIADGFDPEEISALASALALVIGTEAMIVFKDVLQVDDAEARRVTRWAIRALVGAARRPGGSARA